jgi:hypothetical protein
MFDLNQAMNQWRAQLADEPLNRMDLIELEDHLRSEIDDLTCRGLTEEEAFVMARYRLGEDRSLSREYVKANPWPKWRQRFFWALAGILGFNVIGSLAMTISNGAGMVAMFLGARVTSLGILQIAMHAFSLIALLVMAVVILSRSHLSSRLSRTSSAGVILCLWTLAVLLGAKALSVGATIIKARMLSPDDMGHMALAQSYGSWVLATLQSVLLVVVLLALWPRKRGTA